MSIEEQSGTPYQEPYSVDVVMFDSKKKKNPRLNEDVQKVEEDIKGKKVGLGCSSSQVDDHHV